MMENFSLKLHINSILFSRNFENSVKQNEMYEEINEYHQFYKDPQKL